MSSYPFFTIPELCSILKVKESWIRRQIYRNRIPYHKLGRLIRFHRDEINQWLRQKPLEHITRSAISENEKGK